ncbi:MAG: M20/M25/M40 family metallo-hydrolase [Proteobacteria bacterium]|nr:M20/M25/M40 family metallo-hydrolase [Pseudomonadota bacterium]
MRILLGLALTLPLAATAKPKRKSPPPPTAEVAADLMGRALADDGAYTDLVELCDDIGARLSGSPELDRAIAWSQSKMAAHGLTNVRAEPVMVPKWIRGEERAELLGDSTRDLHILALGGSVSTPEGGIEADVLVVRTFEELQERAAEVKGRIVLFNAPFVGYGQTVGYRTQGPNKAAELGAVAALVRSIGPDSLDTPHTGSTRFAKEVTPIPAAAVSLENAELLQRLQDRGKTPRVRLVLGSKSEGEVASANVIGEIPGRESPEEIVVLACHLDSWDVGQGAQDDGAGCMSALHAAKLIGQSGYQPRRTVRVVFYTNEENGLAGARTYAAEHAEETHVAAIESDSGAGAPAGLRVHTHESDDTAAVIAALKPYSGTLAALNANGLREGYAGADIGPLSAPGVPTFGIDHDTEPYFRIHHTEADTIDKIDPVLLQHNVATMTVWAWTLADVDVQVITSPTLRGNMPE